jgi:methylphosphotriester-DNA--protein-cysteine methyltransferase
MINHSELHAAGFTGRRQLTAFINNNILTFAGNRKLKIYGRLSCTSGKRMKTANRVFFINEQEAVDKGYPPSAHCMRSKYLL